MCFIICSSESVNLTKKDDDKTKSGHTWMKILFGSDVNSIQSINDNESMNISNQYILDNQLFTNESLLEYFFTN